MVYITIVEQKSIKDTRKEIEDYKYQKAMDEYLSTPTISDIKINSDWIQEKSGNYIYITGSVTNLSQSKEIRYFKIEAKFYDSKGNVVDSDWTNGTDLEVGESRKFKIIYKYDNEIKNIELSIKS